MLQLVKNMFTCCRIISFLVYPQISSDMAFTLQLGKVVLQSEVIILESQYWAFTSNLILTVLLLENYRHFHHVLILNGKSL